MKEFSIFESALQLSAGHVEDLGEVASIARKEFDERESFICHTTMASIEYACLMIENALLLRTNRGGRVYAGFQKLSQLQPIVDRYLRIADVSESVFIFGQEDWQPPRHPNIRLVTLRPEFRLSREWFLITESSSFRAAFLAFDEGAMQASLPEQVRYWALKTSNASVVSGLVNAVEGLIDWSLAA